MYTSVSFAVWTEHWRQSAVELYDCVTLLNYMYIRVKHLFENTNTNLDVSRLKHACFDVTGYVYWHVKTWNMLSYL